MPNERVSHDVHVVLFSKPDKLVGFVEEKYSLGRLEIHAFHAVFRYDGVEMLLNQFDAECISAINVICIQGCSNQELVLKSFFQRR